MTRRGGIVIAGLVAVTSGVVAFALLSTRDQRPPGAGEPHVTVTHGDAGPRDGAMPPRPVPVSAHGTGTLAVRVRDDGGRPLAARLTFVGIRGTRTPAFTHADIGVEQPGGILAFDRAFIVGDAVLSVPPGDYEVWTSHGTEWDAVSSTVHLTAGVTTSLDVSLRHVVDTPGWISGDFHVHAERSSDSRVPMRHRVYQFVADGVDLIVATDHNVIADYAPVIADLGFTGRLASLRGDEVTTHDWGHFGAFPLAGGVGSAATKPIEVSGHTPASMFAEIRRRSPEAVIDIHHPRLENGRMGYFHLGGLDTAKLRSSRPGFSLDFDAIEVLNGYQDPDRRSLDAVLGDWFAFMRRGRRITATGNSDSHHLTFNLGGYPRNYVQLEDRPLDQLDPVLLARAVKAGRSYFTTGPIVGVFAGTQGIGDTVSTRRGPLSLRVEVRAPGWIDVDRVSILVDGVVVLERPTNGSAPLRFGETLSVPIARDGFVVVRVDGDRPMAPVIGDGDQFKVFPVAITNPIWVDFDGDGTVTPSVVD